MCQPIAIDGRLASRAEILRRAALAHARLPLTLLLSSP
jgi:hypothetical protein